MRLKDVAKTLMRGHRIRISTPERTDPETKAQIWSATLCDAQIIAYGNAVVLAQTVDLENRTTYCMLAAEGNAV